MTQHPSRRVAIWMDHRTALLATFIDDQFKKMEEVQMQEERPDDELHHVHNHHREAHHSEWLKHYYEAIVHHLASTDEILIIGPGQAKFKLHHQIERHIGLKNKVVAVENAEKMADEELLHWAETFWSQSRFGDRL